MSDKKISLLEDALEMAKLFKELPVIERAMALGYVTALTSRPLELVEHKEKAPAV